MCVGLVTMRVTELWMPPRVPVISDPGSVDDLLLRVVHHAHARLDPLVTTARAAIAPFTL